MNRAIILAGGSGTRIGNTIPKQFISVCGKPIIAHTIQVFDNHPLIDDIIIVSKKDHVDKVKSLAINFGFNKISKVIIGGQNRFESCLAAIKSLENEDDNDVLLFHDCARPLVSPQIITNCLNAMKYNEAVTVAIKTTDTIYISDDGNFINKIPDRESLFNAQTPQCFKYKTISNAYSKALKDPNFTPSDDCSVVKRYIPSCKIYILEGESRNFKITYKEDIDLFKIIQESNKLNFS